ncbi:hypothetical protein IF1G_06116 [Cordyceps javanica]|uniref:Uncharacterized protein n=1 Tax=Cordyceps javanica TaxID=43265 RepID=A0A545V0B9_9HYPO|nr:hypothetical protein IF1G_06116 [Cordyceps javanica]
MAFASLWFLLLFSAPTPHLIFLAFFGVLLSLCTSNPKNIPTSPGAYIQVSSRTGQTRQLVPPPAARLAEQRLPKHRIQNTIPHCFLFILFLSLSFFFNILVHYLFLATDSLPYSRPPACSMHPTCILHALLYISNSACSSRIVEEEEEKGGWQRTDISNGEEVGEARKSLVACSFCLLFTDKNSNPDQTAPINPAAFSFLHATTRLAPQSSQLSLSPRPLLHAAIRGQHDMKDKNCASFGT